MDAEKQLVKQKNELLAEAGKKMKNVVAKAIYAFQTTEEYNAILFGWYFKGFKLLRRYMVKHGPRVDLEDLDFEAMDKKIKHMRLPKHPRLFLLLVMILKTLRMMLMMLLQHSFTFFFNALLVLGLLDEQSFCALHF